jgi:hypothetical protein
MFEMVFAPGAPVVVDVYELGPVQLYVYGFCVPIGVAVAEPEFTPKHFSGKEDIVGGQHDPNA